MTTTILETFGTVHSDGTLVMDEKLNVAPGRVKVRVEAIELPDAQLASRFAALVSKCRHDNRYSSKLKTTLEHPAFREIVAMGWQAVPLLLACLERNDGSRWTPILALGVITGIDPVPDEAASTLDATVTAWITWGHEQGYKL